MPDSMWKNRPLVDPDSNVARIIRDGKTTLTLIVRWDTVQRRYIIHEEGSDESLEYSDDFMLTYRLADMYLDGFREGYDRGYAAAEAERAAGNTRRPYPWHRFDSDLWVSHDDARPGPTEGER